MDLFTRQVLARYLEDQQDSLEIGDEPEDFVEYKKRRDQEDAPDPVPANGEKDIDDSNINPYVKDYPCSVPVDMKGSKPFVNYDPTHFENGKDRVYDEQGVLEDWWKSRRVDYTENPEDQNPEMSLVGKYGSDLVVARYLLSTQPSLVDLDGHILQSKEAATLSAILRADTHKHHQEKQEKSSGVSVDWINSGNDDEVKRGYIVFSVKSGDSEGGPYTVVMQFLKSKDALSRIKSYLNMPVLLACTCPSFVWYGAQYYAVRGRYMYLPYVRHDIRPPVPENMISRVAPGKGLNFRVCKHIMACARVVGNWKLKIYYKNFIRYSPLSKIINPKEWERLLGIPFTYKDIRKFLRQKNPTSPQVETFFKYKTQGAVAFTALQNLNEWLNSDFLKSSTSEKLKSMEAYVMHPEEIFYILWQDAVANQGKLTDSYIKNAVILMSKMVAPDYVDELRKGHLDAVPEAYKVVEDKPKGVKEEEVAVGKGTAFVGPSEEEKPETVKIKKPVPVKSPVKAIKPVEPGVRFK